MSFLLMGVGGVEAAAAAGASFTTLDPATAGATLTNGNLTMQSGSGVNGARSLVTLGSSGKYHVEMHIDVNAGLTLGIGNASHTNVGGTSWVGSDTNSYGWTNSGSALLYGGTGVGTSSPFITSGTGETIAIEVDVAAKTFKLANTTIGYTTAIDFSAVAGPYYIMAECDDTTAIMTFNFGSSAFVITPTATFVGLS